MERMAKCDLFVLPSHTEGFPNVILEAMSFGCAIIATDVGAIPEILEDGAGMLFKSQNSDSLIGVLNKVLYDSNLRNHMGICAQKKVFDKFTIDIAFNAYMKIWKNL
jgi:glycosyltransferase involved in cell wall biosynthesis